MRELRSGERVNIQVSEPWDWSQGELEGVIVTVKSDTEATIKLDQLVIGKKLKSNIMKVSTRYEKATFNNMLTEGSVTVGGALLSENDFDYIIIGSMKMEDR